MSHELYSDFLLEHARTPCNRVTIDNPTHHTSIVNEGCSDTIELYLKIENARVVDVGFMGNLCALSTASASLFTEYLKSKFQVLRHQRRCILRNPCKTVEPKRLYLDLYKESR